MMHACISLRVHALICTHAENRGQCQCLYYSLLYCRETAPLTVLEARHFGQAG